jgi:DNA-binding response OmpR family regulator
VTRARVLIVDDEPDAAELLRSDLEAAGHEVSVAVDADGAFDRLAGPPPDVVLLDLVTARQDGWQVLAGLQEEPRLADVGVVVLASASAERDPVRALLHGSVRCLRAPFATEHVLRAVAEVVAPVSAHVRAERRAQLRDLLRRLRSFEHTGSGAGARAAGAAG